MDRRTRLGPVASDEHALTAGRDRPALQVSSTRGRVALTATVAASGMASLDATVVGVALPHIADDVDASVSALQWVLTSYLLAWRR